MSTSENAAPVAAVTVQQCAEEDLGQVIDLFLGYLEFYQRLADRETAYEFLRSRSTRGESILFLARDAGKPVGFAQVYPTFSSVAMAPVWVLNDLYVSADARRAGIGRTLIRTVVEQAAAAGAVRVTLSTAEDNASAQALYESEGFVSGHPVRYYIRRVS